MKTAMQVGGIALIALASVALVAAFQQHVVKIPVAGDYLPGGK